MAYISTGQGNFRLIRLDSDNDGSSISEEENSGHSSIHSSPASMSPSSSSSDNRLNCVRGRSVNFVDRLRGRELYARFCRGPKAKTEKAFDVVHRKAKYPLSSMLNEQLYCHIHMGFTLCGQYFLSFYEKFNEFNLSIYLYIWKFGHGRKLELVSHHKLFDHIKESFAVDKIMLMQFPNDMHKLVCYAYDETKNPDLVHVTILTLPAPNNCIHCLGPPPQFEEHIQRGWCSKHGFIVHLMFATSQPAPAFNPHISLNFPNHLVINTGHHIHILNVATLDPTQTTSTTLPNLIKEDVEIKTCINFDACSEISDFSNCTAEILEDLEYDLESGEGNNKPFHELNICCEPLNVTGRSYHNTLVQNIFDPRIKRLQSARDYVFSVPHSSSQKSESSKIIDKKIAEKAYEFTEENEKYEKISLFRKKRLADKKYEFSEDNTENIVPFHILRRERRYLYRRNLRSPDLNSLFLSPRSPMLSPTTRHGQFSPYRPLSLSPRDLTRKLSVYSPSCESDCSDSDGRLVLRTSHLTPSLNLDTKTNAGGLLIVQPKEPRVKWIKKLVRRYSNGDFENGSLLSGQSRDDYNNPIEVPMLVQNLTDVDASCDLVPENQVDHVTERQILVSQRSMDCEQFVHKYAQVLCSRAGLQYMHCEDYDIKIIYVCPLSGDILCQAVLKIGGLSDPNSIVEHYRTHFLFNWNITTDAFDIIESPASSKTLVPAKDEFVVPIVTPPKVNCHKVWVLAYDHPMDSLEIIRDYSENFQVCLSVDVFRDMSRWVSIDSSADDTEWESSTSE